ncbi:leucine-rich repeat domain-containing protein [Candidatus Uabimicrobium amorphum]|uniref:Gliding protein mglA n=1 Tax=Uabimicrobium amorphum TaxID=2596890 RepID=A0A5S9F2Q9_UABAM|nr:leucine-rich repeat domain-containing protein [Candidatus Uabimicrobium amorphum]BBM83373.1 gliding protein mglA [Candidatus Uabimicrobium amorphum]
MATINYLQNEITIKIAYCGPESAGKKTNLQFIHDRIPPSNRDELVYMEKDNAQIMCFKSFQPEVGKVHGMKVKSELFAICGDLGEAKDILGKIDGIVFVADSCGEKLDENLIVLRNLEHFLQECEIDILDVLTVIQWNKADTPNSCDPNTLERYINYLGFRTIRTVASNGDGVFATLKICCLDILMRLDREVGRKRSLFVKKQRESLTCIDTKMKYDGCTFYLKKNEDYRFEKCIFRNCSFRSEGCNISFVDNCEFSNCGFWGEFVIDLSQKNLRSIPDWVYSATFASTLNLQDNDITDISYKLGKLAELRHLNLDGNEITSIPGSMRRLQNLELLSISGHNLCKEQQESLRLWLPDCNIFLTGGCS